MPPRKKKQQRKAADAKPTSLSSLPPGVIEIMGGQLLSQDKLSNVLTSVRDLAALARCGPPPLSAAQRRISQPQPPAVDSCA